jgi:hypothetical protein
MQKSERNQIREGDYLSLSYFYSTFVVGIGDQRLRYSVTRVVVSIPPLPKN